MKKKVILFLSLILFIISLNVCFAYDFNSKTDIIFEHMLKENYYEALNRCYSLQNSKDERLKAEVFYLEGICMIESDEPEQARSVFKKALLFSNDELSSQIYIGIADTYFLQGDYSKAIGIYEQLLHEKTNSNYKAMLYFKLGKSFQKKSEWAKTKFYFNQLKNKFPDSFQALLVENTQLGVNYFTIQVGCFSTEGNAKKLYKELKNKGYEVYISEFDSNGKTLYRVRVGEFLTKIAAEHTEELLRVKEKLPTHIFP